MHRRPTNRLVVISCAVVLALLPARGPGGQELPPAIEVDRLLVRAERQMHDGDYSDAAATLEEIAAVRDEHGIDVPDVFWIRQGEVSLQLGRLDPAAESATRYLQTAGRSGEHYRHGLELLDRVAQARARAAAAAAILAAAEPLQQLNGDVSCTRVFDLGTELIREVTEVNFGAECRLTIKVRDAWESGVRNEVDVDTVIGPGNVMNSWIEDSKCGPHLGLRFAVREGVGGAFSDGNNEIVRERTWYPNRGEWESITTWKTYLRFERGHADDDASIMDAIRTLNRLCGERSS